MMNTHSLADARAGSDAGGDLTALLVMASQGDASALDRLFPLIYDELRAIARSRLRGERPDHTLSPTALVHEAYLRLIDQTRVQWQNRGHFLAVASQAMRRILVNYAEARNAAKRGGHVVHVSIDEVPFAMSDQEVEEILAIDRTLEQLRTFNPRGADVVAYRFFGGLDHGEIAELLGVSEITVRRSWSAAKTWLRRELRPH